MKKTDWRSVFLEMWEYKGEGETSVMEMALVISWTSSNKPE